MASDTQLTRAGAEDVALLADERRRYVLDVLTERETVSVEALADAVSDREPAVSDPSGIAASLRHTHLPRLADAGTLAVEANDTVVRSESPMYDSPLLDVDAGPVVFEALGHGRRQTVLSILAGVDAALSLSSLSWHVATAASDDPQAAVPERRRTSIAISLHHRHLPKLAEADAVIYDPVQNETTLADPIPDPIADVLATGSDDRCERLSSSAPT